MNAPLSHRVIALVAMLLCGAACGTLNRVITSPDDYQHYRRIRLESTFLGRLGAAWRYLDAQPRGAFRADVERWFQRADERFLLRHWDDVGNLTRYVDALPNAPRTGLARARITLLRELSDRVAREEATFLEREAQRQNDLDAAREARGTFIRTLLGWVQLQAVSEDFGRSSADWSDELRALYVPESGPPACDASRCRKAFLASFEIPRHEGLETRAVTFTLTAQLRGGKLEQLELAGPALFDRLAEAATARPSDPEDLQARAESIGVAAQLLSLTLASHFGDAACEKEAVSPVVLSRECKGRTAKVIAAVEASEEDRIVVTVK
jgi:hypothetical protein